VALAASSADRPTATSSVWISEPVMAPNIAAMPAGRPCRTALPRKSVMSGPGVKVMTSTAAT
jgi:hypothetical protein